MKSAIISTKNCLLPLCALGAILLFLPMHLTKFSELQFRIPSSDTTFLEPSKSSPISYPPSYPEHDQCWIFRCANRLLPYTQQPQGDGFRLYNLGVPEIFNSEQHKPGWCRVDHLSTLRKIGQRCVIYLDDDVYVNLDKLRKTIKNTEMGKIIVEAHAEHGMRKHINSGFIVFTDLQHTNAERILYEWNWRKKHDRRDILMDQGPLNQIIACNDKDVICMNRKQRKDWGLIMHCFSAFDKISKGAKRKCMRDAKLVTVKWDADPLKNIG